MADRASAFTVAEGGCARVSGPLNMSTVAQLLEQSEGSIGAGRVSSVDLSGVSASDSAGIALLIEWLSLAKAAGCELKLANVPSQLMQLAKLGEIEDLLLGKPRAGAEAHATPSG